METKSVKINVADPTTLGLFGLAIVTLVASSQKLELTSGLAYILPWAIFLGGMAQIIAAMFDFKHNNLFGATAFTAFGLFWLGTAMSWLIKLGYMGEALASTVDDKQLGVVFVGYMILSIILMISCLKMSKGMTLLLFLIVILFIGLALSSFGCGEIWHTVSAYAELSVSLVTFYALASKYLNTFFGKNIIPMGDPFIK